MRNIKFLPHVAVLALFFGCSDSSVESPHDDHEHETITTVELKLVNRAAVSDSLTLRFVDEDGAGGAAPILPAVGRIKSGASYDASVRFLDQSNPEDFHDLNEEIRGSESDDHRIFWTTGSRLTAVIVDRDANGLLLGLKATLAATSTGLDTVRINLRHLPGIKTANSAVTDGETDAEVAFPIEIVSP
ncbi:MAG TPA: hypothetical protein PKO15_14795 [Fibrobacteria bacterium]|nr:hypothetical protein [Fibrobacteria bacterium]